LRWQNHLSDLQVQPMQVQLRLRLQGQGNVHHWLAQSQHISVQIHGKTQKQRLQDHSFHWQHLRQPTNPVTIIHIPMISSNP
jgi:hypothetical protein